MANFCGGYMLMFEHNIVDTDECDDLLAIVIQNSQVYYILNNIDGLRFYQRVLRESDNLTKNAKVKGSLEK